MLGEPDHPRPCRSVRKLLGPTDEGRRGQPIRTTIPEHQDGSEYPNPKQVAPKRTPEQTTRRLTQTKGWRPWFGAARESIFPFNDGQADQAEHESGSLAQHGQGEPDRGHQNAPPPRASP